MPSTRNTLALAIMLAAGLSACTDGFPAYSTDERSGTYGSRGTTDDDRAPQARNASPYMRQ